MIKQRLDIVNQSLKLPQNEIELKCAHIINPQSDQVDAVEKKPIASYIDHTILKATASEKEIKKLCQEAIENQFAAVCVNLSRLSTCVELLRDTQVKVAVVVGFPLGATSTNIKVLETREAINQGAHEIDMVIAIGQLLEGNYRYVYDEVKQLVEECNQKNAILKCIIETGQLPTDESVIDASIVCYLAGAHFVKTNTGFLGGGASLKHVKLMRQVVGHKTGVQVKASGGVRSYSDAIRFVTEGHVDRIGTSSGIAIKQEEEQQEQIAKRTETEAKTKLILASVLAGVFLISRVWN